MVEGGMMRQAVKMGCKIIGLIMGCLVGVAGQTVSHDINIELTNASKYTWHLVTCATDDAINFTERGRVVVNPKEKKDVHVRLNNIPQQWPQERQEVHVGHWKLKGIRQSQFQDEMDLYVTSEGGHIQKWSCQTGRNGMNCAVINKNGNITIDLVISVR